MCEDKIEEIYDYVKALNRQSGSHGLDHTERVTRLCEIMGNDEGANMSILIPAALLHDIARFAEKEKGTPHELEGAERADHFLRSIEYANEIIPAITDAILTHRFQSDKEPKTLEAMILSDADKLDAMGAIGVARTFMQTAENGGSIHDTIRHFNDKLLKLKDSMYTDSAKRIAKERHAFLRNFLYTLINEINLPK